MKTAPSFARRTITLAALAAFAALVSADPATPRPAEQSSSPTTAPAIAELPALIDALAARTPAARERSREALMLLTREDLPALRDAARAKLPLRPTQRSLLRDVVVQVYLVGQHRFAGDGPGYVGVTSGAFGDAAAIVYTCTPGMDGYRVLRPSDVIVAVKRLADDAAGPPRPLVPVGTFRQLRAILDLVPVGEWVRVRLIRDGAERTLDVRLGPRPETDPSNDAFAVAVLAPNGIPVAADDNLLPTDDEPPTGYAEGEAYWLKEFEPALAPTTRPN